MPRQPVRFDFRGELQPSVLETACRRRLRLLEKSFPSVREWQVRASAQSTADASGDRAHAFVLVTIVGGEHFEAAASGADALIALRLAFNKLEEQLRAESEAARKRAAHWIATVKSRTVHR